MTDKSNLQQLDELVPWGPQFVTGYAYERWADLDRQNTNVNAMVKLLAGLFAPKWMAVFKRFTGMLEGNRFAVGWLPSRDVSAAIDAYVRINRAGIRVHAEERALALLPAHARRLLDDFAHFVSLRDTEEPVADRRSLLVRESERQMGFAVWMTAVTRYSTLALLGTLGCRWLETSAIDKNTYGYRLDRVGPDETAAGKKTWARANYATPDETH